MAKYGAWTVLFPGYVWLSPGSFMLGLVASFTYGIGLTFIVVPVWNFLGDFPAETRRRAGSPHPGRT